jgi:hypothetical protein
MRCVTEYFNIKLKIDFMKYNSKILLRKLKDE